MLGDKDPNHPYVNPHDYYNPNSFMIPLSSVYASPGYKGGKISYDDINAVVSGTWTLRGGILHFSAKEDYNAIRLLYDI